MKKHLKTVAFCLSVLIFFHGCSVYKSANVSLEEASQVNARVRIKTKDNKKLKFWRVKFESDKYYGLNKEKVTRAVRIDEQNIEKVQVKNKVLSTIITAYISIVATGFLIYAAIYEGGGYLD